jgi:hypothetical protein
MHVPSPHDPYRAADWRARRALHLAEHERRPSRRDDRWAWRAWRYFRALARGVDERQRQRVRQRYPRPRPAGRSRTQGRRSARRRADALADRAFPETKDRRCHPCLCQRTITTWTTTTPG